MSLGIDNWLPVILLLICIPMLWLAIVERREQVREENARMARFAQRMKQTEHD